MNRHLWVDLETGGFDPYTNPILEIGAIITDSEFKEIARFSRVVKRTQAELENGLNNWCLKHHRESGLWDECLNSTHSMSDVQTEFLDFVAQYFPNMTKIRIHGNSVWFDKGIIEIQMPAVYAVLNYRILDVSSIKEWRADFLDLKYEKKESAHRGMQDIEDSIAELKHYTEWVKDLIAKATEWERIVRK